MGVSARTTEALRAEGFDAIHLNDEGLNRLADSAILLKARDEDRVVLTFDLDFGVVSRGVAGGGNCGGGGFGVSSASVAAEVAGWGVGA